MVPVQFHTEMTGEVSICFSVHPGYGHFTVWWNKRTTINSAGQHITWRHNGEITEATETIMKMKLFYQLRCIIMEKRATTEAIVKVLSCKPLGRSKSLCFYSLLMYPDWMGTQIVETITTRGSCYGNRTPGDRWIPLPRANKGPIKGSFLCFVVHSVNELMTK